MIRHIVFFGFEVMTGKAPAEYGYHLFFISPS